VHPAVVQQCRAHRAPHPADGGLLQTAVLPGALAGHRHTVLIDMPFVA